MQNISTSGIIFFFMAICCGTVFSQSGQDTLILKNGDTIPVIVKFYEKNSVAVQKMTDTLSLTWIAFSELHQVKIKGKPWYSYDINPSDSAQIQYISMFDGSHISGLIIEDSPDEITVVKRDRYIIQLQRSGIESIIKVKPGEKPLRTVEAQIIPSHYLIGSNNLEHSKGKMYYQNTNLVFHHLRIGLKEHFSIGAGILSLFRRSKNATIFWIAPKVSYPLVKHQVSIGGGGLFTQFTGSDESAFGILYGSATFGGLQKNITIGIGGFHKFTSEQYTPIGMMSFLLPLGKKINFISENYMNVVWSKRELWEKSGAVTISGLRYNFKKWTLDTALLAVIYEDGFVKLPWLSATIPF